MIVLCKAVGSLAKLLSCSFLMYQPEVTQPALASTLSLKVLSEPMAAFAKEVSNPVPCVCVGVCRGEGGCRNTRNV